VNFNGQLMLYMANLQDYTYNIDRMVSLTPTQFCRSADFHQRQRYARDIQPELLARPSVYEVNDQTDLHNPSDAAPAAAPLVVKRLGWDRLTMEPELLTSAVVDAMQQLDAQYEVVEKSGEDSDQFIVSARLRDNVAVRVSVTDDTQPGAFRIQCARVGGDTFAYHDFFRKLRGMLSDDDFVSWRSRMPRLTVLPAAAGAAGATGGAPHAETRDDDASAER